MWLEDCARQGVTAIRPTAGQHTPDGIAESTSARLWLPPATKGEDTVAVAKGSGMLTLAIQPDNQVLMSGRRQSFSRRWNELAQRAGFEVREVDVYQRNLPAQFAGCDGFLWWFAHLPQTREAALRIVQAVAHGLGMTTFPNWNTVWHFR